MILVSLPKKDNVHQAFNSKEIEEKNEIKNKHKREDKSKKHFFLGGVRRPSPHRKMMGLRSLMHLVLY